MHQKTWVPTSSYVRWGSKYQSNFGRLLGRKDFLAALNCKRRQLYVFNLVVWKEGVYYKRCYLLKWVVIHQVKRKKWLITRLIPLLSMSWCDSSLNEAPSRKKNRVNFRVATGKKSPVVLCTCPLLHILAGLWRAKTMVVPKKITWPSYPRVYISPTHAKWLLMPDKNYPQRYSR